MSRWGISGRTAVHLALSAAVSIPILLDVHTRFESSAMLWAVLAALNVAIWLSWPRYRSLLLRQVTTILTLLVAANLLLSPLVPLAFGEPMITLPPNQALRLRHVGDTRPGLEGIHSLTTDARGHRTNGVIDYGNKPTSALRIVAIGASTTEQGELDDRKTWTALVAQQLEPALGRKVELINTAVAGARSGQYLAALRGSMAYAPDVVLFLTGINDWNHAIKMANRSPADHVLHALRPFSFFESVLSEALLRVRAMLSRPTGIGPAAVEDDSGDYYTSQNNSLERARKIAFPVPSVDAEYASTMGKIFAECRRLRLLCLFIDQPTSYASDIEPDLRRRLWMTPVNEPYTVSLENMRQAAATYNAWLEKSATEAGLAFCKVADAFAPSLRYFYDDCHFTEAGSRQLARLVTDCLLRDGVAAR